MKFRNHMLYIILIPNLIYHLMLEFQLMVLLAISFRNYLVEVNYSKKKVVVYRETEKNRLKLKAIKNTHFY
jgi:ABC-type polysaccharide transport system permease subunit